MSFVTIGGGQAIIAEAQRQSVTVHHWMTAAQFANVFAISRMAPGPGSLYITLIGWHVAGAAGAAAATAAIFAPTIGITWLVSRHWTRFEASPWRTALEAGLKPVAAGLILAGAYGLFMHLNGGLLARGIALVSSGVLLATRTGALLMLAGGATIFLAANFLSF
jgi:chromate transporter